MTTENENRTTHRIIFYTKPGCHLCDDARELIDALRPVYDIEVEDVNIINDPDLMHAYQYAIPVLWVDRRVTLKAPITPEALRRALDGQ